MANQKDSKTAGPIFKIDGVEYSADSLSDNAKSLVKTLRVADRELAQMEAQITLFRIARQTVAASLKKELDKGKAAEKK
jgi:hypothetical protein